MSNSLVGSHGAHKSELNQVKKNTLRRCYIATMLILTEVLV